MGFIEITAIVCWRDGHWNTVVIPDRYPDTICRNEMEHKIYAAVLHQNGYSKDIVYVGVFSERWFTVVPRCYLLGGTRGRVNENFLG